MANDRNNISGDEIPAIASLNTKIASHVRRGEGEVKLLGGGGATTVFGILLYYWYRWVHFRLQCIYTPRHCIVYRYDRKSNSNMRPQAAARSDLWRFYDGHYGCTTAIIFICTYFTWCVCIIIITTVLCKRSLNWYKMTRNLFGVSITTHNMYKD